MPSKFINKFKKSDLDEKNAFCFKVVKVLKEMFPNHNFACDENSEVIKINESKLGLINLRSKFLLTSQTDFELRKLIKEHFSALFSNLESVEIGEQISWDNAKKLVMPQIMPVEFVSKMPVINFPFGVEAVIGIVIDGEKTYQYVNQKNLGGWDISAEYLLRTAIENLTEKSFDIEMTFVPPPNGIVVINTMDGFDAVRIISPQMQEFFAEKLGESFYFGVPNRDFLICWSKQGDDDFHQTIKRQIADDFEEQPYPLSKYVFEFDKIKGIVQLKDFESNKNSRTSNN